MHIVVLLDHVLKDGYPREPMGKAMPELKKIRAREEFARFAEQLLGEKLGRLNAVQQSYAFTRFYVSEIHNRVRSEIPEEELELAIVDASNDLGCDFIHRDDGHVIIIQSK